MHIFQPFLQRKNLLSFLFATLEDEAFTQKGLTLQVKNFLLGEEILSIKC